MYQPEDIFATEVPPSNVVGCGQFSQLHKFAQFQNAACVCRIPMRVLSPPADSLKMCPAGNTYRGTRSGAAGLACGSPMSSGMRCGVALHPRGELASIVARYATIAEPGHSSRRSEWGSSTQFRG